MGPGTTTTRRGKWTGQILRIAVCLISSSLLTSCFTGQQALANGDYYKAVTQSTKRLDRTPKNKKAIAALIEAYPEAREQALAKVASAKKSTNEFRWEKVVTAYNQLGDMAGKIRSSEGASSLLTDISSYDSELSDAKTKAAAARIKAGDRSMANGSKPSARSAYRHYEVASRHRSNSDTRSKMAYALEKGTVHVVINPLVGPCHGLSPIAMDYKLSSHFNRRSPSKFVRFYTNDEANRKGIRNPDEVISLSLVNFNVGRPTLDTDCCDFSKEVVIGKTKADPPEDIVGTVCATVHTYEKSVCAHGSMELVCSSDNQPVVWRSVANAKEHWCHEWATLSGDRRAVPNKYLCLLREHDQLPPCPQDFFDMILDNLYQKACSTIRNRYANLR